MPRPPPCRKCKAVELMAVDALVAAEPLLRVTERLQSAEVRGEGGRDARKGVRGSLVWGGGPN